MFDRSDQIPSKTIAATFCDLEAVARSTMTVTMSLRIATACEYKNRKTGDDSSPSSFSSFFLQVILLSTASSVRLRLRVLVLSCFTNETDPYHCRLVCYFSSTDSTPGNDINLSFLTFENFQDALLDRLCCPPSRWSCARADHLQRHCRCHRHPHIHAEFYHRGTEW